MPVVVPSTIKQRPGTPFPIADSNDIKGGIHSVTNITQRNSVSCIDLAATFDMVDTNLPNNVRLDMVEKSIGNNYLILNGVLPIIKRDIKFKIIYTITDSTDGIVYTGECCLHYSNYG